MLIDVSFAPYANCESFVDDIQKRNCRKEIFIKYLFAIIKYETDKEISTIALDELFEVSEGNLSIPNNLEDYKIRNNQVFKLKSTESTQCPAFWVTILMQWMQILNTESGVKVGLVDQDR